MTITVTSFADGVIDYLSDDEPEVAEENVRKAKSILFPREMEVLDYLDDDGYPLLKDPETGITWSSIHFIL